jgi:hypothetical protein
MAALGQIINIPLEVQFQYAPSTTIIGGVSTGLGASIPTNIPINVSLLTGAAGGLVQVPTGMESELRGVFGPTFGLGTGIELGSWRVNLRYEYLLNLVENSPNVHALYATVGWDF